jgi:ribosomal protein S3
MIGVRVKIMPPDAQFPDKIQIATALPPEEKEIVAPAPAEVKTAAPTPAPAPEPAPEETVVAKEVADEAPAEAEDKTEEAKE